LTSGDQRGHHPAMMGTHIVAGAASGWPRPLAVLEGHGTSGAVFPPGVDDEIVLATASGWVRWRFAVGLRSPLPFPGEATLGAAVFLVGMNANWLVIRANGKSHALQWPPPAWVLAQSCVFHFDQGAVNPRNALACCPRDGRPVARVVGRGMIDTVDSVVPDRLELWPYLAGRFRARRFKRSGFQAPPAGAGVVLLASRDGCRFVLTTAEHQTLVLDLHARKWSMLQGSTESGKPGFAAISPGGERLAVFSRSVELFDLDRGESMGRVEIGSHARLAGSFSPDGGSIVFWSPLGILALDLNEFPRVRMLLPPRRPMGPGEFDDHGVGPVIFSPNGRYLVLEQGGAAQVFDAEAFGFGLGQRCGQQG
jgi:hypothetical protein